MRGFTLIEMLIVVGIVTALSVVGVPNYLNHRQQVAINSEADKILAFVRVAVSKAKSQEGGEVWAIEFVNNGDNDYYQLRKGGAEGVPVNKTYLGSGVEFIEGTTYTVTVLSGGPNVQILPSADFVLEAHLRTKNGNFTSMVSMDALGRGWLGQP